MLNYTVGGIHKKLPFYVKSKIMIRLENVRGLKGVIILVGICNMNYWGKLQSESYS